MSEIERRIKEGKIEYKDAKGKVRSIEEMPKINYRNIARTVSAWLYGSRLKKGEDYYFTGNNSKKYHIKVNERTISVLTTRFI